MAKKEAKTDLWVYDLLKEANIHLDPQGSSIKEIDIALKTASKKGTGKVGFPEYVGVVKDYLLVIEDKADLSKHIKLDDKGNISAETAAITDYAVNGAVFYGKHLAENTSYKKVIVFGVSGDEKKHKVTPVYIDETEFYRELPEVESFISFNEDNIDEYYIREILKENTDYEKETNRKIYGNGTDSGNAGRHAGWLRKQCGKRSCGYDAGTGNTGCGIFSGTGEYACRGNTRCKRRAGDH